MSTNGAERWLRERRRSILLLLVLASIVVRAVYFVQLSHGPCFFEHRWPQWDMEFFDRWARQIAAGDRLTREPLHPYHAWHASVAATYFAQEPQDDLARAYAAATTRAGRDDVSQRLWNRWYGGTRFHQEPLYPYMVALTYRMLGPDVRWVFAWQMLLGVLTNVLLYLLTRRLFGDTVALVAGALALGCSPALFYELVLLRTTAVTFATFAIALVLLTALERGARRWWVLSGAALGLGMLLQSLLGLLIAIVPITALADNRNWRRIVPRNGAFAVLGLALVLAPLAVRNFAVHAPFLSSSSVGAVTFISSNAEDVQPDVGFFLSRHTAEIMGRTDGRTLPAIVETLKTHDGPGSFLRLMAGKLAALTHGYEIPNNVNFYFYQQYAGVLRLLPFTFSVIGPLGLLGLVLAMPLARRLAPLYVMDAASVVPMLAFYVLSRFRAPLLVTLIPFAAYAIVRVVAWAAERRFVNAGVALLALAGMTAWVNRPLPPDRPIVWIQDHSVTYDIYYRSLASDAEQAGDWARAAAALREFLRFEPGEIRHIDASHPPQSPSERRFANKYGLIHRRYAQDLDRAGMPEEAAREARRSDTLLSFTQPGSPE